MRVVGARWQMPAWAGWTSREARIVLFEEPGAIGVGEAAPLPGRSPDTLATVDAALARAATVRWPDEPRALAFTCDEVCAGAPAAAWAIWCAVLDARARARNVTFAHLLGHAPPRLPIAAVVESPDAARAAVARGIRTLKVKIAPPVREAAARVAAIRTAVGPAITLRADGNQQFAPGDVAPLCDRLAPLGLEFVEEPSRTLDLQTKTSPPLALDESAGAHDGPAVAALVLKPTILGPTRTLALAATGRGVLSHALEGPVGVAAAAEVALACTHAAAGLDPHPGLAVWKVAIPTLGPATIDDVARTGTGLDIARVLERARRLG